MDIKKFLFMFLVVTSADAAKDAMRADQHQTIFGKCSKCNGELNGDNPGAVLSCGCKVHPQCIPDVRYPLPWKVTCPVCRQQVDVEKWKKTGGVAGEGNSCCCFCLYTGDGNSKCPRLCPQPCLDGCDKGCGCLQGVIGVALRILCCKCED